MAVQEIAKESVSRMNSLLRGEISAVETYDQALKQVDAQHGAGTLEDIRREHQTAVSTLQDHVAGFGANPSNSSGWWGAWASFVESAARVTGNANSLRALKAGEEHGISAYEAALADDEVALECKSLIRDELLPATIRHVGTLDRLIAQQ